LLVFNCMVGALLGAAVRPWYGAYTQQRIAVGRVSLLCQNMARFCK
jgi:hypothetical protein